MFRLNKENLLNGIILASYSNLDKAWDFYNKKYFKNKLKKGKIVLIPNSNLDASGGYDEEDNIIYLKKSNNKVLIHEMCHQAVRQINKIKNVKRISNSMEGHIEEWQFWMKKCNQKIDEIYLKPKEKVKKYEIGKIYYIAYKSKWRKVFVIGHKEKVITVLDIKGKKIGNTTQLYGKGKAPKNLLEINRLIFISLPDVDTLESSMNKKDMIKLVKATKGDFLKIKFKNIQEFQYYCKCTDIVYGKKVRKLIKKEHDDYLKSPIVY